MPSESLAPRLETPDEAATADVPHPHQLTAFTRMDESSREDWMKIGRATFELQPTVGDRVLEMLRSFETLYAGFGVSQLHHALQTATMAKRANASDEIVLCALCHDIGKYLSIANHASIAAELLRPYVSENAYHIVRTHQHFQGRHYYQHFGHSTELRDRYVSEPWYADAVRFTDEWDQAAFDPKYRVLPLGEFEPLIRTFFKDYPMNF